MEGKLGVPGDGGQPVLGGIKAAPLVEELSGEVAQPGTAEPVSAGEDIFAGVRSVRVRRRVVSLPRGLAEGSAGFFADDRCEFGWHEQCPDRFVEDLLRGVDNNLEAPPELASLLQGHHLQPRKWDGVGGGGQ